MKIHQKFYSYIIIFIYAIVIFLFSYYNIWQGDDLNYRMIITADNWDALYDGPKVPVESFNDILKSQYYHYLFVNGRSIAHTLVQIFCGLLGHGWFAICNSLAYCALIFVTRRLVGAKISNFKVKGRRPTMQLIHVFN